MLCVVVGGKGVVERIRRGDDGRVGVEELEERSEDEPS